MAAEWYVGRDGQRLGPYTADEIEDYIQQRRIEPTDLVWREGMAEWLPARDVLGVSRRERYGYTERRSRDAFDVEDRDLREAEPSRTPPQFPGRLISPGLFVLSGLLFLLPWTDIRCNQFTIASQSGVQLCMGDWSESAWFEQQRRMDPKIPQLGDERPKPAPFIIAHIVAVLAGLGLGLALPVGRARLAAVASAAALAIIMLIVQSSAGFPVREQVSKANADPKVQAQFNNNNNFFPFPANPFAVNPFAPPPPILTVHTTPWFWLAVIVPFAIAGTLSLEHLVVFAPRRPRRPAYY
jgi:hypothetical protein